MMKTNYDDSTVFVIVEGKAEKAIIDILLKNNCLVFSKENLYESRILTGIYRNPKRVVDLIRGKRFDNDVEIFYILDKKTEAESFKKNYK